MRWLKPWRCLAWRRESEEASMVRGDDAEGAQRGQEGIGSFTNGLLNGG